MKTIYTKRYKLRKVKLNDVDNIFKILSDMETVKYLNLPNIDSKESVRDIVIDYLKINIHLQFVPKIQMN